MTSHATHSSTAKRSFIDKCIKDDNDRVVLAQTPNIPILGWFVFTILSKFTNGSLATASSRIASAFIFVWAYLEVTEGANYLRRGLGLIVMIFLVSSFFGV